MIKIPVKRLRPGMVTAQSVYNKAGASYLTRGSVMNDFYIDKLRKLGISTLSVTSVAPGINLPPPKDIVEEKTRTTAIHRVYDTFEALEKSGELNIGPLEGTSEQLLVDVLSNRSNLVQLTDIRTHDDYTFAHSVNVAILSAMLGSLCHLTKQNLLDLVLGSLLHDIGKIAVPVEILTKPGSLTQTEFSVIQMHPEIGREKLRRLNIPSASILSIIASQHHEHMDGRGYPNHLPGSKMHKYSRMVAIADVYDALTSRRPYKPAYKPHIAYKIMSRCSVGQFDMGLLELFFNNVAVYPVGTVLKTTMGYAIVRSTEFGKTLTPTICVFANKQANLLPRPYDVNLEDCPPDAIIHVVEDTDLLPLMYRMQIDPAFFLQENKKADSKPRIE